MHAHTLRHTHTHAQPFNSLWSGTTRMGQYQKKHSPTHTHPDHRTSFINFLHLLRSIASSVFSLHAWQSFLTTSLQVLFGLPLGLGSSTSYSVHFFTQSSSSFRSTCPYQRSMFCCNTNAMSSTPSLSLSSLLGNLSFSLMPHIHLTVLISAHWSATTFSFLTGRSHFHASMETDRQTTQKHNTSGPIYRMGRGIKLLTEQGFHSQIVLHYQSTGAEQFNTRPTLFIELGSQLSVAFVTLPQCLQKFHCVGAARPAVLRYQLVHVVMQSSQDCLTLCGTDCLKLNASHAATILLSTPCCSFTALQLSLWQQLKSQVHFSQQLWLTQQS